MTPGWLLPYNIEGPKLMCMHESYGQAILFPGEF